MLLLLAGLLPGPAWGQSYFFSTFAGTAGTQGSADGKGGDASFRYPGAIALDAAGNVFVADSTGSIRKIAPDRTVTTLAGLAGANGSADGAGSAARFHNPDGLAMDRDGNLVVADTLNHTIRKITPGGAVTTLAGIPGVAGTANGPVSAALFSYPTNLTVDAAGVIYVVESQKYTIRKISPDGLVTTLPGLTGTPVSSNSLAGFNGLTAVAVDTAGNLFVINTEWFSTDIDSSPVSTLWMITPQGEMSVIRTGALPANPTYNGFYLGGLALGPSGDLFVVNSYGAGILKISPSGDVNSVAGTTWYTWGNADGVGPAVRFRFPEGIAVDRDGNLFVADTSNHTIRVGRPNGLGLAITRQPGSTATYTGSTVEFLVEASGLPAPATFQWFRDSTAISGATSPTLRLENVRLEDNNSSYTVLVTNGVESVQSRAATLLVTTPLPPAPTQTSTASSSGGGGGAPSGWFLGALALLFAAAKSRRHPAGIFRAEPNNGSGQPE